MAPLRKTQYKRRGGGPKSRRATAKSASATAAATAEGVSPLAASPDVCGICLEGMPTASTTRKTACNHRFHRKCLNKWCHSRKMTDTEATCPMCKRPIPKDCIAVQPGQNMPDYLVRDILFADDFLSLPGPVDQERRRRKKEYLMELQFPKNFSTTEWKQITSFERARQLAMNDADVRQIIARRYGFDPV